ncbi:MAG: hypothetical protein M1822_009341 [Bathelium mastoideum]|nr:MAG: hypothetical protein M1822_009341 [Bathelium mastoideum]
MVGWSDCSTSDNRGCWLKNDETGAEFSISTNYEDINSTPTGINRNYVLNITDGWVNADGMNLTEAKLFNNTYPGHNSAFEGFLLNPSILLNGKGNVTRYNNSVPHPLEVPSPYTLKFERPQGAKPKRHLLRLINTSFESTFVFSIDNHTLEIIESDFVPIQSYRNTSVLVGIGQRYNVIVEANDPLGKDGNYWIRTWRADCFRFPAGSPGYETAGIVRYGDSEALPTTSAWNVSLGCSDETYESLKPIREWTVGEPANDPSGFIGENFTVQSQVNQDTIFPLAFFSMGGNDFNPMKIDFGNPTFLNLDYSGKWPPLWVIFPENYTDRDWVYMVLHGLRNAQGSSTTGAHPIHLHGHDFAILQQIGNTTFPDKLNLTLNNPPRRDVVLLPTDGYVVIAFKTDNPGSWLMHCHIANHASAGLALQILERQQSAVDLWPSLAQSEALQRAQEGCNDWNEWWGDCSNWWAPPGKNSCLIGANGFLPDSGI